MRMRYLRPLCHCTHPARESLCGGMAPFKVVKSAKFLAIFVLFPLVVAYALKAFVPLTTHLEAVRCAVYSSLLTIALNSCVLHPLRCWRAKRTAQRAVPPRRTEFLSNIALFVMLSWFWHVGRFLVPFDFCSQAQCNDFCSAQYTANQDDAHKNLRAQLESEHHTREQTCKDERDKWKDAEQQCLGFKRQCILDKADCLSELTRAKANTAGDNSDGKNRTAGASSAWQQAWEACCCFTVLLALAVVSCCCCTGSNKKGAKPGVARAQQPQALYPQQPQAFPRPQQTFARPQQAQQQQAPANFAAAAAGLPLGSVPEQTLQSLLAPLAAEQTFCTLLKVANQAGYSTSLWNSAMATANWTSFMEQNQASLQSIQALTVVIGGQSRPAFVALLVSTSAQLKRLLIVEGIVLLNTTRQQETRDKARDHFLAGYQ